MMLHLLLVFFGINSLYAADSRGTGCLRSVKCDHDVKMTCEVVGYDVTTTTKSIRDVCDFPDLSSTSNTCCLEQDETYLKDKFQQLELMALISSPELTRFFKYMGCFMLCNSHHNEIYTVEDGILKQVWFERTIAKSFYDKLGFAAMGVICSPYCWSPETAFTAMLNFDQTIYAVEYFDDLKTLRASNELRFVITANTSLCSHASHTVCMRELDFFLRISPMNSQDSKTTNQTEMISNDRKRTDGNIPSSASSTDATRATHSGWSHPESTRPQDRSEVPEVDSFCLDSLVPSSPHTVKDNAVVDSDISRLPTILFWIMVTMCLLILLVCETRMYWIYKGRMTTDEDDTWKIIKEMEKLKQSAARPCKHIQTFITAAHGKVAKFSCRWPKTCIATSLVTCLGLSLGLLTFQSSNDPIELWSISNSQGMNEMNHFREHFRPFHRILQIFLVPKSDSSISKPLITTENVQEVLRIFEDVSTKKFEDRTLNTSISLYDVCYIPLQHSNAKLKRCATYGIHQWIPENQRSKVMKSHDSLLEHFLKCSRSVMNPDCMADMNGPVSKYAAFGGISPSSDIRTASNFGLSLLLRSDNAEIRRITMKFEAHIEKFLASYESELFEIRFLTERSIEDQLERDSRSDIPMIILSYTMMIIYISVFIAPLTFSQWKSLPVNLNVTLALAIVLTTVLATTSTAGLMSLCGVRTSFLTLQVLPFLLLAIGSGDNFIYVRTYHRIIRGMDDESFVLEDAIIQNVTEVGPSLFLSSLTQFGAFCCAIIIPVRVVRYFAIYCMVAVTIKFLMQITLFTSIFLYVEKKRLENRWDLFCCVKSSQFPPTVGRSETTKKKAPEGLWKWLQFSTYVDIITMPSVGSVILLLNFALLIGSLFVITRPSIGFDFDIVLPDQSNVRKFFDTFHKSGELGPPAFLVLTDSFNYEDQRCLNLLKCPSPERNYSLLTVISDQIRSDAMFNHHIYSPQWSENYLKWIGDNECCKTSVAGQSCIQMATKDASIHADLACRMFGAYTENCNMDERLLLSNHTSCLVYRIGTEDTVSVLKGSIQASRYMMFHSGLKGSPDYIRALISSRKLVQNTEKFLHKTGCVKENSEKPPVYVYSTPYVFYEQYLQVIWDFSVSQAVVMAIMFVVISILLGFDLKSALVVIIMVFITTVEVSAFSLLASVQVNSVSMVNSIMSTGIMIEFFVHIVRDVSTSGDKQSSGAKRNAIRNSLRNTGKYVILGVSLPELMSLSAMVFAKSQLFTVYFFRMYIALVIASSINAILVLPQFLAIA